MTNIFGLHTLPYKNHSLKHKFDDDGGGKETKPLHHIITRLVIMTCKTTLNF